MFLNRKKSNRKNDGEAKKLSSLFNFFLGFVVFILVMTVFGVIGFYAFTMDLPGIDALKDYRPSISSRVYDDKNELIDEFFLEDRKLIKIKEVPRVVVQAFVAAEDSRFFAHKGFDLQSIFRAVFKNIEAGHIIQGGSTITQQVAKMMYLSPEKKYTRKFKEAILAYKIDRYLTKDEILNLYLNQIYLGHGTYGIESASLGYFGKSARELKLHEAALLAGMPKAPSNYSPFLHYDKAKQRQYYVLTRMKEDGYISQEEMEKAYAAPMNLRSIRPKDKMAAYFVETVRRYVQEKYGADVLYKEGLSIYTTLDLTAQKYAGEAMERGLKELEERNKYKSGLVQGALFCMDVRTGAIRAMVGGRDFNQSEFNRATQSRRQAGSAFKPIIYTAAFDKGMTPATVIDDSPLAVDDVSQPDGIWRPKNFDDKFMGPITMRTALVLSRNVVTVKILQEIGIDYAVSYAMNMGITSPLVRTLSLALGASGVTLQELVQAYGVLANQGQKVSPFFIKKIVDRTGNVFEETKVQPEQVIDPRIAFITTHVMQDVVTSGTGTRVRSIGRPVAAKTGTTNDTRDAWFIGMTPSLITGVWIGFDQEASLGSQEVGGRAAAPIWLYFMEKALQNTPVESFPVPEGIVFEKINPKTGEPAGPSEKGTNEAFLLGTSPSSTLGDSIKGLFR
ncbi:MAG TPA: PBP1A family penicillin-binding protein [Smithella sp.]|jgi:penicillin-binding protein 1A|nr:MAG: Penicillin-binding protein 2D [Deltaproteobacteria bacterium ADurb.Bin022]HNQ65041.1 PBP1A family penicillin-binding protein [Smithella sp.]HOE32338.1 PBP1A family penicillin-binding protein [Smithella sp.]HOG09085.1 PBP1A family penicillin-binding protein [Smithella sp.]HOS13745.1 PBP1A family penicillin-binding protein [Smithella sp.]